MSVISIIVPVYNVEKYLDKCVRSILAQTFKDFELILVDDGSTDNSGKMCDEYLKSDKRIKVIHKENGGLSSARNAGIKISAGELIGFIDSDDYIDSDMYELLYNNMMRENADMSICGKYDCYKGKGLKINKACYKVLDTEEALYSICEDELISPSACNKLYKRELFENISYPEKKAYEDAFVIVDLLLNCKKIVFTSEQKYYYNHREDSITTYSSASNCFDIIEAWQKNYDLINLNYPDMSSAAIRRVYLSNFCALDRLMRSRDEQMYIEQEEKIIKFLRSNSIAIIFKSKFSIKRKISMFVLIFSKSAYKKMLMANFKFISPLN